MAFETWIAFTAAAAVLLVIPGPTILLVVSYALGQGWRVALPMAFGVALGRAVYAMTRFDVGNVWLDEVDTGDLRYGGAIGLGADTALGPIYCAYGHADGGENRVYFSMGTAF